MAKFGKGDLYDKANKKSVQHSLLVFVPKNGAYHKKDKQGKLTDEVGGYFATVMIDQSLFNPDKVKSGETKLMHNGKEDQGSMKGKVQVNPYFSNYVKKIDASRSQTGKDRMITRHDTPYTLSQINAIAAATNNVPEDKAPTSVGYSNGTLYGITASVMIKKKFIPDRDKNGNIEYVRGKDGAIEYRTDKDGKPLVTKDNKWLPKIKGHYVPDVLIDTSKPMGPTKNRKFGPETLKDQQIVTQAARDKYREIREAQKDAEKQAMQHEDQAAKTKPGYQVDAPAPSFGATEKSTQTTMQQKMDNVGENLKQMDQQQQTPNAEKQNSGAVFTDGTTTVPMDKNEVNQILKEGKQASAKAEAEKTGAIFTDGKTTVPMSKDEVKQELAERQSANKEIVTTPVAGTNAGVPKTPSDNSLQAGAGEPQTGGDSTLVDNQQMKSPTDPVPKDSPSAADDEPDVDSLPF